MFDAYGTLFDTDGAAMKAASEERFAPRLSEWAAIAKEWRSKQLEYVWIRSAAGCHADFWTVTCDSLDYVLEGAGLDGDAELRQRLLALYKELPAYREVPSVLSALKTAGHPTAILSNGTPEMLSSAISSAGIDGLLDAVLSVESVGVFKPHKEVYELVGREFGCAPADVLFVSSNGWDAAAAAGFGFESVWVARRGHPVDRLPWKPAHVIPDLEPVARIATGSST